MEASPRLLDQPQKKNDSALSQSGRIGPPNRCGQSTAVYDGLHKKREGSKVRQATPNQGRDCV